MVNEVAVSLNLYHYLLLTDYLDEQINGDTDSLA